MRSWFKSSTALETPEPPQIHNHTHTQPGYAGPILAVAFVAAVVLFGLERYLVHLFESMHVREPEAAVAALIWLVLLGTPALLLANYILHGWADASHQRRIERDEIALRRLELQHRLQMSSVADSRAIDPAEKRRNALITAIMYDAFSAEGDFGPRDKRPWARRNAGRYTLAGESEAVGENSTTVLEAADWLRDERVIIGTPGREQINRAQFPNLAAVQRHLHIPPTIIKPA